MNVKRGTTSFWGLGNLTTSKCGIQIKKSGLRVVLGFFKPNFHIPRSELRVGGESQLQPRLGCLTLDSQLRGHRAAWKQLQKVLKGEFLDAKMCKYQARSRIVGEKGWG